MHPLYLFLKKYYYYFLFLILEIISGSLLVQFNEHQNTVISGFTGKISGRFNNLCNHFSEYLYLKRTNELLSQELIQLQEKNTHSWYVSDSLSFITRDTSHILEFKYIGAKVISNSTNARNNYMMINKGSIQGVKKNMGAVVGKNIVGQVVSVTDHFSWIMTLLNKNSKISGKFLKNNQLVNIEWHGGDYKKGIVSEIPKHFEINKGDTIITSGNSEVFPEGFLIGTIESFIEQKNENFNQAIILYATDFNGIGYIEIVVDLFQHEKDSLRLSITE